MNPRILEIIKQREKLAETEINIWLPSPGTKPLNGRYSFIAQDKPIKVTCRGVLVAALMPGESATFEQQVIFPKWWQFWKRPKSLGWKANIIQLDSSDAPIEVGVIQETTN